jgi:histidinol-phosphate aminotransferase
VSPLRPVERLRHVAAYRVPSLQAPIDIRLDGNEGAVPPVEMLAELAAHGSDLLRRYPELGALEALIAERHGVRREQVLVTAGADEALDRACRALVAPGAEAVVPVPTFEMLERYLDLCGARVREVAWGDAPYPIEEVLSRIGPATAAVAVVSPNNPTGGVARADDIVRIARAAPEAAVLVDLAYGEFADDDLTPAALSSPNAIVFKTVSKAWGLAGLRIGYALAAPEVIGWMRAAGGPYPNASISLRLAAWRLSEGEQEMERFVRRVREEREILTHLLRSLGAAPYASQANFVLARFPDWRLVWEGLGGLGIAVRPFPGRPHLDGCIRITCPGRDDWFARLAAGLRAVMAPQALLFDLDGVLADVSGSYREAIVQTAASFGVAVSAADISALKAEGGANNDWDVTRRLMLAHGVDIPLERVTERFESLYQGTDASPGLRASERLLAERSSLERLSARLPMAIVTGRPRRDAKRFLEDAGVADLMQAVVCMEDGPLKPDPGPVRLALQRLGVERGWMVGDTPDDVRAARAAGVVPLAIAAPGEDAAHAADVLSRAGAARVLAHLSELEEMLK